MKLFELTNPPTVPNDTHSQAFMRGAERGVQTLPTGQQVKILGSGVEAIAFTIPGEIGVVKVMTTRNPDLNRNPYLKYASISRRFASSNPFLPRISQISQQHVDVDTWAKLKREAGVEAEPEDYYNHPPALISFKTERLVPLSKLDIDQLRALYHKAFGEELNHSNYSSRDPMDIVDAIETSVDGALYGKVTAKGSAQLVMAIKLIRSISKKTKALSDLHSGNLMARMTTGGPQLVITDPLIG